MPSSEALLEDRLDLEQSEALSVSSIIDKSAPSLDLSSRSSLRFRCSCKILRTSTDLKTDRAMLLRSCCATLLIVLRTPAVPLDLFGNNSASCDTRGTFPLTLCKSGESSQEFEGLAILID